MVYRSALLVAALTRIVQADLASTHRAFADALVPLLYSDPTRNDCTSALGVSMAFSLIYPSMIDPTLTDTATVLGFPPLGDEMDSEEILAWSATESALESAHDGSCIFPEDEPPCTPTHPTLLISNSVWLDADRAVNTNYTELLPASVLYNELAFSDQAAGATVNAWVNQSTNGLIDSIVDVGPLSGFALVAINAIYLKADWAKPFQEQYTSQDVFYTSADRSTVQTEEALFLHTVADIPYGQTSTHQVIALPLASKDGSPLTMTVALPFRADTPALATSEDIIGLELNTSSFVALALPKFTFESEYSSALQSALADLGLESPFQTGLCVYADDACTTSVDKIIQKTVIAVNEQGVEAAAVTALIGRNFPFFPDGSTEFLADHPFQFFIHSGDVVLFEGNVVFPESDGVAPLDVGTHASPDEFWSNAFGVLVVRATPPSPSPRIEDNNNGTVLEEPMTTTTMTQAPVATPVATEAPVVAVRNIFAPTEAPVTSTVGQAPETVTETPAKSATDVPTQEPAATSDSNVDADARTVEMPSAATPSSIWMSISAMLMLARWFH